MTRSRFCTDLLAATALAAATLTAMTGCHSYHVDTVIENRSGEVVKLLEVDYPNASFGADAIAAGADFHYRFQVQGNGPIKVQYTRASGDTAQATGPILEDHEEGRMEITLLPGAKVEFHPQLRPKS
jgi:hypothetical protein